MRIFIALILVLGTSAFAGKKIVSVKGENQGVVSMKGRVEALATNWVIGCYKVVFEDGVPAYVASGKDVELEAKITETEFSYEVDISKKGFCQFKPSILTLNISTIGEGRTFYNVAFTDKKLPADDNAFTHIYLRDVEAFDCIEKGRFAALDCTVVMKDGRRLDRNGLGMYIDTKKDKEPISFNFLVH